MTPIDPRLRRLQKARTSLLINQPFFGMLAMQMDLQIDASIVPPTACTNGQFVKFHPDYVDSLDQDHLVGLMAHEVMHPACGHCWRRDGRDPWQWNLAADYAIDPIIIDAGFRVPDQTLNRDWRGKSAEWIFDRLPQNKKQQSPSAGQKGGVIDAPEPGQQGNGQPGQQPGQGAPVLTESDWKQLASQAAHAAQTQGKLPASLVRLIQKAVATPVDWRSLLLHLMQDHARNDYSYRRPNARYLHSGFYLPSLHSEQMGRIAFAIDTSGSIDDVLINQFAAQAQSAVDQLQPSSVDVLWCDASLHRVDTFERGEPLAFNAAGGGGTDFRPVFEHYSTHDDPPVVLVYLTDMYGTFPDRAPDYPVIWASIGGDSAPFGDIVPIDRSAS